MDYRGSCDLGVSLPSESFDWLDFVRAVYVCQQLESPIRRYAGIKTMNYIRSLTSDSEDVDLFKDTKYAYAASSESDDRLDQVLGLVIEESNQKERKIDDETGKDIMICLNKLLYPKFHRQEEFLSSVRNGSVYRAFISARVCESLLIDSVSILNCFSLLNTALESGCQQLAHACLECCLAHFSDAIDQNRDGFTQSPAEVIQYITQHDCLNVPREEDVLAAISIWVEYDMVNRMGMFVDLFATGIRFTEIDYFSLANIVDSCELIGLNQQAIELAAHELIQKTMGTARENAMGLGTICRPRKPHKTSQFDGSHVRQLRHLIDSMISHGKSLPDSLLGKENVRGNIGNVFNGTEFFVSPTKMEGMILPNKMLLNVNGPTRSLSHLLLQ